MFRRSRLLSPFQLATGYQPSFLGILQKKITFELLEPHRDQGATRILQAFRHSPENNIKADLLKPGDMKWSWYKDSKQNEKNVGVGTVHIKARQHYIEPERSPNSRTMRLAYEDLRLRPQRVL